MEIIGLGVGPALIAIAGGLLSFFSPCVAPLVPGYIGYLSGTAVTSPGGAGASAVAGAVSVRQSERRVSPAMLATALFVVGFSVAFIALGLLAASFGRVLAAYQPVIQTVAGIVMLAMGAFLLGWLPREVMEVLTREGRLRLAPGAARRLGAAGPLALGMVFGAGWTPCIGPVLAAILAYAGASADVGASAVLLTMYSLGFAVPFLAVGFGWSAALKTLGWAKRHGAVIAKVSGVLTIAVAVLYLTGQITVFAIWAQRIALPIPR